MNLFMLKNYSVNGQISDHGLSNRVEQIGEELFQKEQATPAEKLAPLENSLTRPFRQPQEKERLYVGCDGIMVPIRDKQGADSIQYRESGRDILGECS